MKILLASGPPRAGKDHFCKYLYEKYGRNAPANKSILFEKFSEPLKKTFAAISAHNIDEYMNVEYYESYKENIIPWLGVSYRQFQIDLSEKFFKPVYGNDIFGRLFIQRLEERGVSTQCSPYKLCLVSDAGFDIEIEYLEQHYNVDDILLIRIHRPGYDFTGDSRSYAYPKLIKSIDVYNDGTQKQFEQKIEQIYQDFMHNYGKILG